MPKKKTPILKKVSEKTKVEKDVVVKEEIFEVIDLNGGFVRTYSVKEHGEKAEELAREFAEKKGYKVK